ncbi:MAG: hypothetical protein EWV75_03580 [Microcystis wesenbergii Mw_QC_S_20081001_S30D]|uniref:Uncharacterized protein n=2 Tax=Microcystis wesenbergii TaxID=44823 RepID=A0A552LTV7_9CHRO|nr:MAG: hypothetical protein EWV74_20660 [Microcystis wesenbergii Mw_QC_S_20081001_S30]TRU98648.1 MAG: hypothetical protein EWV73_14825 [Microcystis wesenbergii Mw_QC_B_20070930_S4D]TRV00120.1 MAG: hypothetical protein EWV75_03580 [Microcystis wesenbergii Mw_QC_S_20081001_S30D]TRV10276.1 MAG: hypothetical protein EWV41_07200 [Microcystis wesenbergii Mw_MB_S_20031200_S109]TRV13264.1 MAG: hypothetical protein EWV89_11755 [Microcystis wesenbergii Mw_QC_B_20070930_S4]TRV23645.1 MAG: hypothetical p
MKKFSPPQMKEVSFPTPHTPHPTPSFKSVGRRSSGLRRRSQNRLKDDLISIFWLTLYPCQ